MAFLTELWIVHFHFVSTDLILEKTRINRLTVLQADHPDV